MIKNNRVNIVKSIRKQSDFSFSKNTTYGCGGNARIAYYPESIRQATSLFDYLKDSATPFIVLGNGSNVLASDSGYDGAVISTKNLKGVYITGKTIYCRAGTKVSQLMKFCIENGAGGLEYLAGIPATLGGLALMNGGADSKYICSNIVSVKFYDGKMRKILNKNCNFGNKYSIMRDINGIILGVELTYEPQDGEKVMQNIRRRLDGRAPLPKGKSCGCVFKNPSGYSAGKLIDEAGLKGLTYGTACVSGEHANFIINKGVRAADVYALIGRVKNEVYARFGILLEEEVVYIGDMQ